jgi:DnaK suppressor protein
LSQRALRSVTAGSKEPKGLPRVRPHEARRFIIVSAIVPGYMGAPSGEESSARVSVVGEKRSMQSVKGRNGRSDETLITNGKTFRGLDKIYRPTDREPFMSDRQREYFRVKLMHWRDDILKEAKDTLQHLQDDNQNHSDLADRASSETDRAIELRARDRQRKLISKIDAALQRIDDGTYGYCEETGEPISLKRLEARPIATLSIEAQERHERRERVYREE